MLTESGSGNSEMGEGRGVERRIQNVKGFQSPRLHLPISDGIQYLEGCRGCGEMLERSAIAQSQSLQRVGRGRYVGHEADEDCEWQSCPKISQETH